MQVRGGRRARPGARARGIAWRGGLNSHARTYIHTHVCGRVAHAVVPPSNACRMYSRPKTQNLKPKTLQMRSVRRVRVAPPPLPSLCGSRLCHQIRSVTVVTVVKSTAPVSEVETNKGGAGQVAAQGVTVPPLSGAAAVSHHMSRGIETSPLPVGDCGPRVRGSLQPHTWAGAR